MTADTPTAAITRVRLRFAKRGDLRLASHHDLMRCLERTLRRADLPVAHSQGFNPRPKVVFALALALGIEGRSEVVEIDLAEPLPAAEVLARLAATAPPGLDFFEAEAVAPGRPARAVAAQYRLEVPPARRAAAAAAVADFLASGGRPYTRHRPDRTVELDLRPSVLAAEVEPGGALRFRLQVNQDGAARPEEIVEALGLRDLMDAGAILVRDEIVIEPRTQTAAAAANATTDETASR